MLKEKYKSIAIITKTDEEARKVYELLKDYNKTLSLLESIISFIKQYTNVL